MINTGCIYVVGNSHLKLNSSWKIDQPINQIIEIQGTVSVVSEAL